MRTAFLLIAGFVCSGLYGQKKTYVVPISSDLLTPFEASDGKSSATYVECREFYRMLNKRYPEITMLDSWDLSLESHPVYTFRIYTGYNPAPLKILIMNNIHPGEPEGTDASMMLARDILTGRSKIAANVLNYLDITIICQYNTDGTVNRGCCTRANQNGPEQLGFRGTDRNLDLNRDFVKCDSRQAQEFARLISQGFDIFIDNHTSNGADYQYTLTWFHTRTEKLDQPLVPLINELCSTIKQGLNRRNIPTAPYVETRKQVPDSGIVAFWESPRYSTGFAALHHCMGFTVETHMWKPFADRVNVTYEFMEEMLTAGLNEDLRKRITATSKSLRLKVNLSSDRKEYIDWKLDESHFEPIEFLGYKYSYPVHPLTGLPLLHYDRSKPVTMKIPYYNRYVPTDSVLLPRMYIIPKAWKPDLMPLLIANGIKWKTIATDSIWPLRVSYVVGYETTKTPYEGHYLHYNTSTRDTLMPVRVQSGDMAIIVNDANRKFLAAVLEPRSADSYFNWGFFDAVLQQKEWFSDYVWADRAKEILDADPVLKAAFEKEKSADAAFASNSWAQLAWVYKHSVYYEPTHNRVPVYRLD